MNATAEASILVRQIAEPRPVGDSVKAAMGRAHRALRGWTFNRVRDVWHADHRIKISADEMAQLRAAVHAAKEESRDPEIAELRARIAYTEERLQRIDPSFFAPTLKAIRATAPRDRK